MRKFLILVGLPGSGKTTFADNYAEKKNSFWSKVVRIDPDKTNDYNQFMHRAKKDPFEIIKADLIVSGNEYIIDYVLLTNDDIIRVINDIVSGWTHNVEIEIHFWNPDRDACLFNDKGRRKQSSEGFIKNAVIEEPDIQRIKSETGCGNVTLYKHTVFRKPEWKVKMSEVLNDDCQKYLKSSEWITGGLYGNCYNDSMSAVSSEEQPEFTELDSILEKLCPSLSFLQYKKLMRECVTVEEHTQSEYYGGFTNYSYYQCNLEKLYSMLQEMNLV